MLNVPDRGLMSASSTSSSTSCSQESEEPKAAEENDSTLKKRVHQFAVGYANSSMSTLDRSHYQSLPFNGTRRVTVLFGEKRIVVPWKESDSTVGQLADAALCRYKKHMQLMDTDQIRVLRMECASDGGILDMDDVLEEVFDLNFDQILAITDEASGSSTPTYTQIQKHNHHYAQPLPYSRKMEGPATPVASAFGSVSVNNQAHRSASPYNVGYARGSSRDAPKPAAQKERRDSIVEVSGFEAGQYAGLKVSTPKGRISDDDQKPILRSSLRTEPSGSRTEEPTPTKQSRVTLSPEVEKKLAEQEGDERKSERRRHYEKNPGRFSRGSDRKSRITDTLLDARDRIVEKLESSPDPKKKGQARGKIEGGPEPGTTIITFPQLEESPEIDEATKQMGIEVNAVSDEAPGVPSTSSEQPRLSAVQVMKIEEGGRVAKDGRIRVGDCIREIDGRPVSQMSIMRARAYIADMAHTPRDVTLLIMRSLESFVEQEAEEKAAAEAKPILSALQQANTQYIGHTTIVELIKSSNGFGFTVTGRETAKGERLFYIGTVKPYGVALGHLKSGDRLLEINGESTGQWTQSQIVDKLKETMVGAKIRFLVSRVSQAVPSMNTSTSSENKENEGAEKTEDKNPKKEEVQKIPLPALLTPPVSKGTPSPSPYSRFELVIPVNGSGSAGLGVSLKARVSKKSNGVNVDCGIFIKNVMHGGAAFKDGRPRENDRIVGVEDVDLEPMSNTEASNALARKLKEIGPTSSFVRLTIQRNNEHPGPISRDSSRITVDAPSPSPSSRMSSNTAPNSVLQSPQIRATSSSGVDSVHSRQSSSSSSQPVARHVERDSIISDARLDETEMPDTDPFDREAPGRKSLSEKRGLGAAADPQHIKLFQEIKHQRQNSAPTASTQKRSKSQPRSLSQRNYRSPMKLVDLPQAPEPSTIPRQLDDCDMLNRRSQSMESINRPVESILRGTGQVSQSSSSKVQFIQGTSPNQHPFPPGSALLRLKSEESRSRDKSRRKSVGNAMRNFFGFGSKSRDASPEKTPVQLTSVERSRPLVDDRLKSNTVVPPPPPPHQGPRRGSAGGVYVDYGQPYGLVPQYPHNTTSGYESYADSELYDRYAAHRYHPRSAGGGVDEDDYIYRQQSSSSLNPSTYVNYGLPASHAYHVDARVPPSSGGSVSAASMRRTYPVGYDEDVSTYQHIAPSSRYRQGGSSGRGDYHHMFNSWFAYSGGGAVGAAPLIKSAYGASPVRIAAASSIERGDSGAAAASTDRRGRSTSSGALSAAAGPPPGAYSTEKEKYADARSGKLGSVGGSTRLFIPRHGGGISAAAFASGYGTDGYETRGGSPSQYRRRDNGSSSRFSQY